MKKIKKVFTSFSLIMSGAISKVYAAIPDNILNIEAKYGPYDPSIFEPTMGEKILIVGRGALPIILFAIGLFVVLSKKITKKVKAIIISILVILLILGYELMNYIAINYYFNK